MKDDAVDARRCRAGRGFGGRQQILGTHADGAHRAFGGCLAGFGGRFQRQGTSGEPQAIAIAADKARLQQVHGADEAGDEFGGGPVVERRRRRDLLDAALVHDDDAVGDRQRFGLVVGDHDEGGAEPRLQPLQFDLHLFAQMRVERRQRLVEQQHARLADDGAGERDALALAARQFGDAGAELVGQADHVEGFADALCLFGAGQFAQRQAEADIFGDVHMRKQRVVLEHGVDRPVEGPERGDIAAVEQHLAARRAFEAGDDAQAGGLAAARRPEQGQEFAADDVEIDGIEPDDAAGKNLRDRLQPDERIRRHREPRTASWC